MKLRLSRQLTPEPICISGCFRVAHVHRPFEREANFSKHGSIKPEIALGPPEHRMQDILFGSPSPGLGAPKRTVIVTTGLNKSQKIVVGYVVAVDGELRNGYFVGGEFVVPAKFQNIFLCRLFLCHLIFVFIRMLNSERGASCGNFHEAGLHARRFPRHFFRATNLFFRRQPVQHVSQRFRMHQAMFDGHVEHLQRVRMAFLGPLQRMFDGAVEFFAHALLIAGHFRQRRPILRWVRGQSAADGIDAERKKFIKSPVERAQTKGALREQVPVKRLDMANVENDAMSLGDGPIVEGFFANDLEKFVGACA